MPYYFEPSEPVPEALRRVATEELTLATSLLKESAVEGRNERIHEARKSLKKLRALIRLGRSALTSETFDRQNATFRDSARRLSNVRTAAAALECFEKLVSEPDPPIDQEVIALSRGRLEAACSAHHDMGLETIEDAIGRLEVALQQVNVWDFGVCGWSTLSPGLKAIYSKGRKGMKRAFADGTTESFHAWRKQVKYLWYSIRLIEPCWPRTLRALAGELDVLGETLGHEHDLADVERLLLEQSPAAEAELPAVLARARDRRQALRDAANRGGQRVFVETPRAFARRLGAYFGTWREESRSECRVEPE